MTVDLRLRLGQYGPAVERRIGKWESANFARRLWEHDPTLWATATTPEITDRLGWLDSPNAMASVIDDLEAFGVDVVSEGFRNVVVLGMGGSSLAPEVFQATLGNAAGHPRLLVLDSTHPAAVIGVEAEADPSSTIYIVASKSGGTLETMSFFRYFWAKVADLRSDPGAQFVAITDPGSSLETLGTERGFRKIFLADPNVGGRYSALTHFGLVPAAAIGADVRGLLAGGQEMAKRCGPESQGTDNPGLRLGAAIGELALLGRDKVTFIPSAGLGAFPAWLEQLIAESTGKDDTGIVPIGGEPIAAPDDYGSDRVFVTLTLHGDAADSVDGAIAELNEAGHPVIDIAIGRPNDIGGAMYLWEVATAAAGAALDIQPFDQPDVQLAKTLAAKAMDGGLADTGQEVLMAADPALESTLIGLLTTVQAGDYLSIHAYLQPTDAVRLPLQEARLAVRDSRHIATTLDFGPRFLHSTGQLHKGGPNTGVFIQVVDHPQPSVPVPETDYDFGKLISAQATGDLGALAGKQRRVLTVDVGDDLAVGLRTLRDALTAAARA